MPPTAPSRELHVFPNPQPARDYLIRFEIPEFTCVCPLTGQPDFARFTIEMVCDRLCVELKSLKLYFWSCRDDGAFHEKVTNDILDDIVAAAEPRYARILAQVERARRHLHRGRRRAPPQGLEAGASGRAAGRRGAAAGAGLKAARIVRGRGTAPG